MLENDTNNELDDLDTVIEDKEETLPVTNVEKVAEELKITANLKEDNNEKDGVIKFGVAKAPSAPAIKSNADGVISSGSANKTSTSKTKVKPVEFKDEKVAIFSTKNVTWNGVGKVYRGYNIVTKEAADKWKTRDHIRIATPEEIAKEFGK